MIKKKNLIFLVLIILVYGCSFDDKTGIWSGNEEEKRRISQLKERQNQIIDVKKIYSTDTVYSKEITLSQKISLSEPQKNLSWKMSSLNNQNFLGNIYLSGINNILLKKKIGKSKYSVPKNMASPIIYNNNIILSDDTGTIFNIDSSGNIIWKKNIYKKIYKKIY